MGQCEGRVAIVTGASRGIGVAIAERLAAEGASVAIAARTLDPIDRIAGSLRETVERLERHGGVVIAVEGDLADPDARARIVERTVGELGPVDILVNNAAAAMYQPVAQATEKRLRLTLEINFFAPWQLAQAVMAGMCERREGWILNISSATSKLPRQPYRDFDTKVGAALYGSSKAALERFSVGLAAELSEHGVVVNSLAPVAAVKTEGADAMGVVPEAAWREAESLEAMAEAALALCVPRDPAVTGRIAYCTPILEELGIKVHTLDGRAVHGDGSARS